MTVIVTGSRHYADRELLWAMLDKFRPTLLVHGDARGADELADAWARARGVEVWGYPANWTQHGAAAGPIRNLEMIREHPDAYVLAFPLPGSKGTWHCVRNAQAEGMRVLVFEACSVAK